MARVGHLDFVPVCNNYYTSASFNVPHDVGWVGYGGISSKLISQLHLWVDDKGLYIFLAYGYLSGTLQPFSKYTAVAVSSVALVAAFTLLVTTLIVGRLVHVRRRIVGMSLLISSSQSSMNLTNMMLQRARMKGPSNIQVSQRCL
jgi:hypothetical protein